MVTLFDRKSGVFKKFAKIGHFLAFSMNFCLLKMQTQLASLAMLNATFSVIFKHCENVLQKSEMKKMQIFFTLPKKQLATPSSFCSWSNYVIALGQVLWRVSPNWL